MSFVRHPMLKHHEISGGRLLGLSFLMVIVGAMAGCKDKVKVDPHEEAARRVFREQCSACHALGGQGSHSSVAMDHEGASRTEEWLEVQIRHPEKHNPDTAMPLFPRDRITDAELHDLAEYLASLK